MRKMTIHLSLIALILSIIGSLAPAQEKTNINAGKVDALFARYNDGISPGLAVLAVRDGKVLLSKGYGLANLEHRVPITSKTVFDIASVSKQFAGLAVSMLIEDGKIALGDDIRKYIPEMPDFGPTITIDHLVHHTSGLRDWPGTLALAGWKMQDVISYDQILNMAFRQQRLNFPPGAEYLYSNTGYNVLAEMIRRVTGQTFRQWTEEHIFKPLGMKATHFQDDHTEVIPNKANGYFRSEKGKFFAIPNGLTALGSSSLYTSIDDLSRWVINFLDPRICSQTVIDRMLQRGVLNSGSQIEYAFGLGINRYRGLKTISHGGSWASFRTYLVHFPDQRFSVVTLMNHSPADSNKTAHDVADIYLADELKPRPKPRAEKPAQEPAEVPISVLDEYVGTYRLGPAWYVTISREGNQLLSTATQEASAPLTARSNSLFWVEDYGAAISFRRDKTGRIVNFGYRGMTCPKLSDTPAIFSTPFPELIGQYESEELQTIYTVVEENGKLWAKHPRHGKIRLNPAWKDDFSASEWFMRAVEFTRDVGGKVDGFKVTAGRSRNQVFKKR